MFGVCAAVVLYRREALEHVARGSEVMDPRFVMHKEDVDLAWRLQRAGFSAGVDGDAVAFHARGTARAADSDTNESAPIVGRVRAILRQERQKSRMVRRLAWRNHLLLIIKNDTPSDSAASSGRCWRSRSGTSSLACSSIRGARLSPV